MSTPGWNQDPQGDPYRDPQQPYQDPAYQDPAYQDLFRPEPTAGAPGALPGAPYSAASPAPFPSPASGQAWSPEGQGAAPVPAAAPDHGQRFPDPADYPAAAPAQPAYAPPQPAHPATNPLAAATTTTTTAAAPPPHRTGSPIIPPGIQPAGATAGLCLLIALTALLGRPALAFAVVLLQAVTAAGWFRLNGMWPARQGIVLAFAAGLTADAVMLTLGGEHAPATAVGALGAWCLLILLLQLRHRGAADERLYAFTVTVSATVVTVLAAGHLAAWSVGRPHPAGADGGWSDGAPVVIGAAAVAVAVLVRALLSAVSLRLPELVSVAVALAAAAGAGAAVGELTGVGTGGALLGAAAGGCALLGLRVASYDWPSRFVHLTAGVALPITAAAPAVYLIGRVLAG